METIKNFKELTEHLKNHKKKKRIVVVNPKDSHIEYAIERALNEELATFLLIGDSTIIKEFNFAKQHPENIQIIDEKDPDKAAVLSVEAIHQNKADILMKGLINTDNLLRVILNKEKGLLPKGTTLTHLSLVEIPSYEKFIFFSDAAVIPRPTLQQRVDMINYAIDTCHKFGIAQPKVSLIHCTEKVSPKFPHSLDYVEIVKQCEEGGFDNAIIDGPLDVKTSCEKGSAEIKGIVSPINGEADVLIFPNIESANTFYKSVSLFANADMAGLLQGPICPVILPSRSDSALSKYYSLVMACLTSK